MQKNESISELTSASLQHKKPQPVFLITKVEGMQGSNKHTKPIRNTGRWSKDEKKAFVEGLEAFGTAWPAIKKFVKTRSGAQIRSHAQKYFRKQRKKMLEELGKQNLLAGKKFLVTKEYRNKDFMKKLTPIQEEFIDKMMKVSSFVENCTEKGLQKRKSSNEIELPPLGYFSENFLEELRAGALPVSEPFDGPVLLPRVDIEGSLLEGCEKDTSLIEGEGVNSDFTKWKGFFNSPAHSQHCYEDISEN